MEEKIITTENFRKYISVFSGIEGAEYVRIADVVGATGVIEFYNDYESFIREKPHLSITNEVFERFFNIREHAEKILLREPVKLLKNLPSLGKIKMKLWSNNEELTTEISRTAAEKQFDISLNEIMNDTAKWIKFIDKMIEDDKNRKNALNEFLISE